MAGAALLAGRRFFPNQVCMMKLIADSEEVDHDGAALLESMHYYVCSYRLVSYLSCFTYVLIDWSQIPYVLRMFL